MANKLFFKEKILNYIKNYTTINTLLNYMRVFKYNNKEVLVYFR